MFNFVELCRINASESESDRMLYSKYFIGKNNNLVEIDDSMSQILRCNSM